MSSPLLTLSPATLPFPLSVVGASRVTMTDEAFENDVEGWLRGHPTWQSFKCSWPSPNPNVWKAINRRIGNFRTYYSLKGYSHEKVYTEYWTHCLDPGNSRLRRYTVFRDMYGHGRDDKKARRQRIKQDREKGVYVPKRGRPKKAARLASSEAQAVEPVASPADLSAVQSSALSSQDESAPTSSQQAIINALQSKLAVVQSEHAVMKQQVNELQSLYRARLPIQGYPPHSNSASSPLSSSSSLRGYTGAVPVAAVAVPTASNVVASSAALTATPTYAFAQGAQSQEDPGSLERTWTSYAHQPSASLFSETEAAGYSASALLSSTVPGVSAASPSAINQNALQIPSSPFPHSTATEEPPTSTSMSSSVSQPPTERSHASSQGELRPGFLGHSSSSSSASVLFQSGGVERPPGPLMSPNPFWMSSTLSTCDPLSQSSRRSRDSLGSFRQAQALRSPSWKPTAMVPLPRVISAYPSPQQRTEEISSSVRQDDPIQGVDTRAQSSQRKDATKKRKAERRKEIREAKKRQLLAARGLEVLQGQAATVEGTAATSSEHEGTEEVLNRRDESPAAQQLLAMSSPAAVNALAQ